MTKVGNSGVILSGVLFVPESEVVTLEVDAGENTKLPVRILITSDESLDVDGEKAESVFKIEYETTKTTPPSPGEDISCVILKFHNFNKSYGQTLQVPQVVGIINGVLQITFLAAVYKFGRVTKLEYQFMLGAFK